MTFTFGLSPALELLALTLAVNWFAFALLLEPFDLRFCLPLCLLPLSSPAAGEDAREGEQGDEIGQRLQSVPEGAAGYEHLIAGL